MTRSSDIVSERVEVTTFDGATVSARVLRRRWCPLRSSTARTPVLVLGGHMRPVRMSEPFARRLLDAPDGPDRVALLDYRGRDESSAPASDDDVSLSGDAADVVSWLDGVGWHHVDIIANARGGLVAMAMAPVRPGAARRVVLNDIGPVLDGVGIARLRLEASRRTVPGTWEEAVDDMRDHLGERYPAVADQDWPALARLVWNDEGGVPASAVDPKVIEAFASIDPDEAAGDFWPEFGTLATRPLMLVRAEHGDMLSDSTVERMSREASDLEIVEAPGHGHPALLHYDPVFEQVARFLRD